MKPTLVTKAQILAIEPYYHGSHKQFLDQLSSLSRHQFSILPGQNRAWKWQMLSAPLYLQSKIRQKLSETDIIFCSDFLDLASLGGLVPEIHSKKKVVYFHENQWEYPRRSDIKLDYSMAFKNLMAIQTADCSLFNSNWNLNSMKKNVKAYLDRMPDKAAGIDRDLLFETCEVVPLGIQLNHLISKNRKPNAITHILWNHRWDFDKAPEIFFEALKTIQQKGLPFKLILCGAQDGRHADIIEKFKNQFLAEIEHFGYCKGREEYENLLQKADVVISTASHEFFGISICEAIAAGAWPLLPNRLSYPEIIPKTHHQECLYSSVEELTQRLTGLCNERRTPDNKNLVEHIKRFDWSQQTTIYDNKFSQLLA